MNKKILGIISLIVLFIGIIGCAGGAKPVENSGLLTLDQAISEAANRIDERITRGSKIAPLNFNSPHDRFSNYVLEELTANLVDSRILTVVDRREIDLIRNEFDFQFSGEVADDSMQRMGQMLGAQSIISGSFTDMGGFYRIMIRVLNVQNATVEVQYRANITNDTITTALLTGGRTATTQQRTTTVQTPTTTAVQVQTAPVQQTPAQTTIETPVQTTFNVGDRGPAGGFIFFDKGYSSDGWQYLEVASRDAPTAHWGPRANGTRAGIGTGRQNTNLIVRTDDTGTAAHRCQEYRQGGYNDWFLPSKDELNLMYQNLKQRGLGSFSNSLYWSSTQYNDTNYTDWAWAQNFRDGSVPDGNRKAETLSVRPIRQF